MFLGVTKYLFLVYTSSFSRYTDPDANYSDCDALHLRSRAMPNARRQNLRAHHAVNASGLMRAYMKVVKMSEPTKAEISQVFKRLRGIGPNKVSGTDCSDARR